MKKDINIKEYILMFCFAMVMTYFSYAKVNSLGWSDGTPIAMIFPFINIFCVTNLFISIFRMVTRNPIPFPRYGDLCWLLSCIMGLLYLADIFILQLGLILTPLYYTIPILGVITGVMGLFQYNKTRASYLGLLVCLAWLNILILPFFAFWGFANAMQGKEQDLVFSSISLLWLGIIIYSIVIIIRGLIRTRGE